VAWWVLLGAVLLDDPSGSADRGWLGLVLAESTGRRNWIGWLSHGSARGEGTATPRLSCRIEVADHIYILLYMTIYSWAACMWLPAPVWRAVDGLGSVDTFCIPLYNL